MSARLLTIPAHPHAYGKRAREMDLVLTRYNPATKTVGSGPALVLVAPREA